MREDGNGEWKTEREQRIGGRAVVTEIINNNREPRISVATLHCNMGASRKRCDDVNRMRANTVGGVVKPHDAVRTAFSDRQFVAACDFVQSLRDRSDLRGIGKRNVNAIRG